MVDDLVVFCAAAEPVPNMRATRSSSLALIHILNLFFTERFTATDSLRALFTDVCPYLCKWHAVTSHKLQRSGITMMLSKYECHLPVDSIPIATELSQQL